MELVVIRHGETQANAEGRYLGALDVGLNDTGTAQVARLAQLIAAMEAPFQRLLTSPLLAGKAECRTCLAHAGAACPDSARLS